MPPAKSICICGRSYSVICYPISIHNFYQSLALVSCADLKGGTGGPDPPEKSQKYRVSWQYWSRSPEKLQSYQASIQFWAIIKMAFGWGANDGALLVVFRSSHQLKKKHVKVWLPLTKLFGSTHEFEYGFCLMNARHYQNGCAHCPY